MGQTTNDWGLGEIVTLPRQSTKISNNGIYTFDHLIDSKYVCVRPAIDGRQRGILVKILGKCPISDILVKRGEPFCKDDKIEGFNFDQYYSFRFPTVQEVQELLDIVRDNPSLKDAFSQATMRMNPESTFWVREVATKLAILKKPQYYNAKTGELGLGRSGELHYRVTIVYFDSTEVSW